MAEFVFFNSDYTGQQIEKMLDGLFSSNGFLKSNGLGTISAAGTSSFGLPILVRTSAPTVSTVGEIGQLCVNKSSSPASIYICTAISGSTYTWTKIGSNQSVYFAQYGTTTYAQLQTAYSNSNWIFVQKSGTNVASFGILTKFDDTTDEFIFTEITSSGATLYSCKSSGWTTNVINFINKSEVVSMYMPGADTQAAIGTMKVYDKKLYVCVAKTGDVYTWQKIGGTEYDFADPNEDGHLTISLIDD